MKNKKSSSHKIIAIVAIVLLVLVGSFLVFKQRNANNSSLESTTKTEKTATEQNSPNTINLDPSKPSDNDDINKQKESVDTPKTPVNTSLSATITNASQNSATTVIVRVLVEGATTGTCKLVLTNAGATVQKSTAVILRGNTYTCDGFTIDKSELSAGDWKASVTVESNGTTSPAGEATVSIT